MVMGITTEDATKIDTLGILPTIRLAPRPIIKIQIIAIIKTATKFAIKV